MADLFYGLDRGDQENEIVTASSSPTKDIEIVIDDAVGLTKAEVIQGLQMIINHIIKEDNY
jgi:hypothetical protein